MTIESHAKKELERLPDAQRYTPIITKILEVIASEGHSGGSMGVFAGMMSYWSEEIHDPKEGLIKPIYDLISDCPKEDQNKIIGYVQKLMTFTPLTDLTGEDSEWNDVSEQNGSTLYQNNRMSSLFREGIDNSKAYWLEGAVRYIPYHDFTGWSGFTGRFSKVPITFPFNPSTEPERHYFADPEEEHEILGNPNAWLRDARRLHCLGILKDGKVDLSRHVIDSEEDFKTLISNVKKFYRYSYDMTVGDIHDQISECEYVEPSSFYQATFRDKNNPEREIVFKKISIFRNFLRLITELGMYAAVYSPEIDSFIYHGEVYRPGAHYQSWVKTEEIHPVLNIEHSRLYVDKGESIDYEVGDDSSHEKFKYLYQKCKELGLEYKGEK